MMASKRNIPAYQQCPLCGMNVFQKATALSCGHTLCHKCLVRNSKIPDNFTQVSCPVCKEPTPLTDVKTAGPVPTSSPNTTATSLVVDRRNTEVHLSFTENYLTILKEIDLPAGLRGITRLSDDTVVIGYGSAIPGAQAISVTGDMRVFLDETIGAVRDITILSDRSIVVSHGKDIIRVYDKTGFPTDVQFHSDKCRESYMICSDKYDNVYGVNFTNGIYVFQAGTETPLQVIPTGGLEPCQVCATTTGKLITRSYSTTVPQMNAITLYDRNGTRGNCIKATEGYEYLQAAVDSLDRVFVGRVHASSGTFRLTIYRLEGLCFVEEVRFKDLKLPLKPHHGWHYMVCLTPHLLALGTMDKKLYFIHIHIEHPGTSSLA